MRSTSKFIWHELIPKRLTSYGGNWSFLNAMQQNLFRRINSMQNKIISNLKYDHSFPLQVCMNKSKKKYFLHICLEPYDKFKNFNKTAFYFYDVFTHVIDFFQFH